MRSESVEERPLSVRVGVDSKLSELFGGRGGFLGLLLSTEGTLPYACSSKLYTPKDINQILSDAGTKLSYNDIVGEQLKVDRNRNDFFYFEECVDPQGKPLYRLRIHKEDRW